jgi:hypothetical protein
MGLLLVTEQNAAPRWRLLFLMRFDPPKPHSPNGEAHEPCKKIVPGRHSGTTVPLQDSCNWRLLKTSSCSSEQCSRPYIGSSITPRNNQPALVLKECLKLLLLGGKLCVSILSGVYYCCVFLQQTVFLPCLVHQIQGGSAQFPFNLRTGVCSAFSL